MIEVGTLSRIFLMFLAASTGVAQAAMNPALQPREQGNAALKYFHAYAAFHQATGMSPDTVASLKNWLTVSLDDGALPLVVAAEEALRELHRGANLRHCDWAVSAEDGPAADTSHRGLARELVAVAGLRARVRFRDGQYADAADDVLAAMFLTRHLSLDGSLASPLIADTLEQELASLLARQLPRLDASELRRVAIRLDALPRGATLAQALLSHEQTSRTFLLRVVRGARDRDELLQRLRRVPALQEKAAEFLDGCGGTAVGVSRCVEQLRPRYRAWAQRFNVRPERFEEQFTQEAAQLSKTNAVFRMLTPSVARLRWADAYRRTQRALLRAAVAVHRDGVSALRRHLDPYDGRPFEQTVLEGGFRLQSRLKRDELPLAMTVGGTAPD